MVKEREQMNELKMEVSRKLELQSQQLELRAKQITELTQAIVAEQKKALTAEQRLKHFEAEQARAGQGFDRKDDRIKFYKHKAETFEKQLLCQNCKVRQKEVVLAGCGHCLCQDCMDQLSSGRSRMCPFDQVKFTREEVIKINLSDALDDQV